MAWDLLPTENVRVNSYSRKATCACSTWIFVFLFIGSTRKKTQELFATLPKNAQSYLKYVASGNSDYLSIAVAPKRVDGWVDDCLLLPPQLRYSYMLQTEKKPKYIISPSSQTPATANTNATSYCKTGYAFKISRCTRGLPPRYLPHGTW